MLSRIAKYALAPVFIPQGLRLRHHSLNLPEPDGARRGRAGQGRPLRILIIGDSSAAGVGACTQADALSGQLGSALSCHFDVSWQLEAKTGNTTRDVIRHLSKQPDDQFDVVVQALGVNDVTSGIPARLWRTHQQKLHNLCRRKFGFRRLYLSGLPPMGEFPLLPPLMRWVFGQEAERFDRLLQNEAAQSPDALHLSFDLPLQPDMMAPDGFHPGPRVYHLWAEALAQHIIQDFGQVFDQDEKEPT